MAYNHRRYDEIQETYHMKYYDLARNCNETPCEYGAIYIETIVKYNGRKSDECTVIFHKIL